MILGRSHIPPPDTWFSFSSSHYSSPLTSTWSRHTAELYHPQVLASRSSAIPPIIKYYAVKINHEPFEYEESRCTIGYYSTAGVAQSIVDFLNESYMREVRLGIRVFITAASKLPKNKVVIETLSTEEYFRTLKIIATKVHSVNRLEERPRLITPTACTCFRVTLDLAPQTPAVGDYVDRETAQRVKQFIERYCTKGEFKAIILEVEVVGAIRSCFDRLERLRLLKDVIEK